MNVGAHSSLKLCYLADAPSVHIRKWVVHFVEKGYSVHVISFRPAQIQGARVHYVHSWAKLGKLRYLLNVARARDLIRQIKPDVLQAFHVTSYGLLAALSGVHPLIVTAWGTDILLTPRQSPLHHLITRYALRKADYITATGPRLGEATAEYAPKGKEIVIIPYGVDLKVFSPDCRLRGDGELTIGAIRHLKSIYGLDYLLRAMPMILAQHPSTRLLLVGDGPQRSHLQGLAQSLGISNQVQFVSNVPHQQVPSYLARIDIFVMPSISEGFGVAALEASAMEIPVIASNVGGVPDTVVDGKTGFLVPPKDPAAIAAAVIELIEKPGLRLRMGRAGRKFVAENYEWNENASRMEKLYDSIVQTGIIQEVSSEEFP